MTNYISKKIFSGSESFETNGQNLLNEIDACLLVIGGQPEYQREIADTNLQPLVQKYIDGGMRLTQVYNLCQDLISEAVWELEKEYCSETKLRIKDCDCEACLEYAMETKEYNNFQQIRCGGY
jgi:hypothetical protein